MTLLYDASGLPAASENRLDRLLRPRSIAVFGGVQAAAVVEQSRKMGFSGKIWPVHPKRDMVAGEKAYRGIDDLPGVPDAAFVGVNRSLTVTIVEELRAIGAGGAVCFAAGFSETGAGNGEGGALQAALVEAAGEMPIVGPNCYGVINYCDGALLWPDQHGGKRLPEGMRGAAIVTQSSNIAVNLTMQRRGLPLAYVLTAGNQAQTGLSEMALGLLEDPRVSVLGLHIEAFDSVANFERLAARARALGKPIVAMKAGRSQQAREAAVSHTASIAGSDAAADAFLARLGIARVHSVPSFLETMKLLHCGGPLAGRGVSSMSCSGGEAGLMADAAHGRGIGFPALDATHRERVGETLGPLVAVANPLDYNTFIWNDEPALKRTFTAFATSDFACNLLVLDFPREDRCSCADWWPAIDAFESALSNNASRGAIVVSMTENVAEAHAEALIARGLPPLMGIAETMDALEAAAFIAEVWASPNPDPLAPPPRTEIGRRHTLDEATAKDRLAGAGLPVAERRVVADAGEAVRAAEALGFPVAVKALGVAHKSERGAVRLALGDAEAVAGAAGDLADMGSGLLVERMIPDVVGELIAGVTRDPQFGPVLTIGTGGVLVELLGDSRTVLLPAKRETVEQAIRSLRLSALLDGYRGRPRGDVEAAVTALMQIADFAVANAATLVEMDINPLIVCKKGAFVADALIVEEEEEDHE
ncbi:acetate--CoA ligase family protein [Pararhizobium mangrovi]|uniref:Acetate--CoA ligase family protein n=1 Tax=Pararhizobium mangrovi TaxID=2590452 RepID=A0A506U4K5_9HYPH|nr:acetate--CoA ligase family protein [Pararhizobium mangrovi]TPW27945.1 acetate--CoA ligase family protein [Pararhizobium mangrovi]